MQIGHKHRFPLSYKTQKFWTASQTLQNLHCSCLVVKITSIWLPVSFANLTQEMLMPRVLCATQSLEIRQSSLRMRKVDLVYLWKNGKWTLNFFLWCSAVSKKNVFSLLAWQSGRRVFRISWADVEMFPLLCFPFLSWLFFAVEHTHFLVFLCCLLTFRDFVTLTQIFIWSHD